MPWLEFIQPWRPQVSEQEPERWQFRMQRPDEDGWPSDETLLRQYGESYYFDCNLIDVERWCYDYTIEDHEEWPPEQWRVDQCITDNVNRCAQVLTEEYPYENGWVQVRACDEMEISCGAWSKPLVVPEPDTFGMLVICVLLIVLMFRSRLD